MTSVLFYIPNLSQDWGGSKQYSSAILRILSRLPASEYRILVYHNTMDEDIMNTLKEHKHLVHITDSSFNPGIAKRLLRKAGRVLGKAAGAFGIKKPSLSRQYLEYACKDLDIDIVHCPYQFLPEIENVKMICTMHDVQEIHFPEFFSAEVRATRAVNYLDYLRRSDAVIVSYDHIKDDIVRYFPVTPSIIFTLLPEFDNLWFDKYKPLKAASTGEKYLLYPANTWAHKNHLRLIDAVALARDKYGIKIKLYCTGHLNEHSKELFAHLTKLQIGDQVRFLGVLDEQGLFDQYVNAHGVVIPTLYEAGSFPLVESIFLNVPVICSNVTSLPGMIGDDRYVFDPYSVESITSKMVELYTDEHFRAQLKEHLPRQKDILNNKDVAGTLKTIYKTLKNG